MLFFHVGLKRTNVVWLKKWLFLVLNLFKEKKKKVFLSSYTAYFLGPMSE